MLHRGIQNGHTNISRHSDLTLHPRIITVTLLFFGISPLNIPWNIKINKIQYSRKIHPQTRFFWNMDYSGIFQKTLSQLKFVFFEIWNIFFSQNSTLYLMEYRIFQFIASALLSYEFFEYRKFQKNSTTNILKFWNIEYSINILKSITTTKI